MKEIYRPELVSSLKSFMLRSNGLVTGVAGIGKSFILEKINQELLAERIPSLIIRVDMLVGASDFAINQHLSLPANMTWSEYLVNIFNKTKTCGVLIIDAFDAARDEVLRKDLITFFIKATNLLRGKWNLIVSCRTYDAQKSPQLLKIFPSSDLLTTNSFEVPRLSSNELETYFLESPIIGDIYTQGTQKLQKILTIPFYLWLLEQVINAEDFDKIKKYSTEEELLSTFWQIKVNNQQDNLELYLFLINLSKIFMEVKKLELNRGRINLDDKNVGFLNFLIQEGILEWSDEKEITIRFTHHILFDYSIARLFLDSYLDARSIENVIEKDQSITFFYKPSFIYYFAHYWSLQQKDKETWEFWGMLSDLLDSDKPFIQLFIQVVPMSVVVFETDENTDWDYLFTKLDKKKAQKIIYYYLQGLQFLKIPFEEFQFSIFNRIAVNEDSLTKLIHVWCIVNVLEIWNGDEGALVTNSENKNKFGEIARNIFSYIFSNRENNPHRTSEFDRLGSYLGIKFVCRTFGTDLQKSKELLGKVLNLLGEFHSNYISYFSTLTKEIKYIISSDLEFALEIFNKVYLYREQDTSFEETGGIITSFRMRKSDLWRNCNFHLNQAFFQNLLPSFPSEAIKLALDIALYCPPRIYIKDMEDHISKFSVSFEIKGLSVKYIPDVSSMWDYEGGSTYTYSDPIYINIYVIDYLEKLIINNGFTKEILEEYILNCRAGFSWKQLLKLGIKRPNNELLREYLFAVISNPVILSKTEIISTAIRYIRQSFKYLSESEQKILEDLILIFRNNKEEDEETYIRFFSSFSLDSLSSKELKKIYVDEIQSLEKDNPYVKNVEPVSFSVQQVSRKPKDFFEPGLDVNGISSDELNRLVLKIEMFSHQINHVPVRMNYESILEHVFLLFNICFKQGKVVFKLDLDIEVLTILVRALGIILSNPNSLQLGEVVEIGRILDYASDESNNVHWRNSSELNELFYSPSPLTESAKAYPRFYFLDKEKSTDKIISLSSHKNATVRLQIAMELMKVRLKNDDKLFWHIINKRIPIEENPTVLAVLILSNLSSGSIWGEDYRKVLELIKSRCNTWIQDSNKEKIVELILVIAREKNSQDAKLLLENFNKNHEIIATIIFNVLKNYSYYLGEESFYKWFLEYTFGILSMYRQKLNDIFNEISALESVERDEGLMKKITNSEIPFRESILRTFFALDIKSSSATQKSESILSISETKYWYFKFKPILEKVIEESELITDEVEDVKVEGVIFPTTAYYFMQLLTGVIAFDPRDVLLMAEKVVKLSSNARFNTDTSALRETTKFVDVLLTDYKWLLQDDKKSFNALVVILDKFANSGWSEALKRIWSLDEIFR